MLQDSSICGTGIFQVISSWFRRTVILRAMSFLPWFHQKVVSTHGSIKILISKQELQEKNLNYSIRTALPSFLRSAR